MFQMLIKILVLILSLLSLPLADNGQNTVNGSVVDKSKSMPLQGANVQLDGNNDQKYGATTDSEGKFNIDDVEDGKYNISISFIGFDDYKENVSIESGKTYKVDAVLEIQPIVMSRLETVSYTHLTLPTKA